MKENLTPNKDSIAESTDCNDDKTGVLTAIKKLKEANISYDYDSENNILYIDWDPLEVIADLLTSEKED